MPDGAWTTARVFTDIYQDPAYQQNQYAGFHPPHAGQRVTFCEIPCVVVSTNRDYVWLSPLGVPMSYEVRRSILAGKWIDYAI